jgi:hypothetical protein
MTMAVTLAVLLIVQYLHVLPHQHVSYCWQLFDEYR